MTDVFPKEIRINKTDIQTKNQKTQMRKLLPSTVVDGMGRELYNEFSLIPQFDEKYLSSHYNLLLIAHFCILANLSSLTFFFVFS